MDTILQTYLDADFLSFVGTFFSLAVAGLILGVLVYLLGWFVTTVKAWIRTAV